MSQSGNAGWNPTDVAAIASGADTAAVLAGQVITFPSGATVTVPVGSTLVGTILTTSDGNSIDLATLNTDTFAALAGQVITFADGSTLTVPTGSTIVGDVITTSDGNSYDLSTLAADTFATLSGNTLTLADGSTIDIPELAGYKQGAANTVAEVLAMSGMALDAGSTDWLTTNRAIEAAAEGVRNFDGTLGWYSKYSYWSYDALGAFGGSNNGQTLYVVSAANINGNKLIVDPPKNGHVLRIMIGGVFDTTEFELSTVSGLRFFGVTRDPVTNALTTGAKTSIKVRGGEVLEFTGIFGNSWLVSSYSYRQKSGTGWRENEDGTVDMWGSSPPLLAGSFAASASVNTVPFPVAITTPLDVEIILTAHNNSGYVFGSLDVYQHGLTTATGFDFSMKQTLNGASQGTNSVLAVNWVAKGGRLA